MPTDWDTLRIGAVLTDAAAPISIADDVAGAARYAEAAGLDSLWVGDHLAMGKIPLLEATLVLAAAAAATERIWLGTAVFVPALRPLAWAAKQVATLTHLSGLRPLQLGVSPGAGLAEDHRAAGFAREERGVRTDNFLDALPDLLRGRPALLPGPDGPTEVQFSPPVEPPTIWIGGTSTASWRRAARYGDGWLAGLLCVEDFVAGAQAITALCDKAGRGRLRNGLVVHAAISERGGPDRRTEVAAALQKAYGLDSKLADRLAIGGTPQQVAEQLHPFVAAGAEHIVVINHVGPWPAACDAVAMVREHLDP